MPHEGVDALSAIEGAPGFARHVLDQLPSALIVIDAGATIDLAIGAVRLRPDPSGPIRAAHGDADLLAATRPELKPA